MNKRNLFLLLPSVFLLFSCSTNNKKEIVGCNLIGDLRHVQYWNKYDKWDLSSLSLAIEYKDNSVEYLKGDNPSIIYNFLPETPSGLSVGTTSLMIYDSYYAGEDGNKYSIQDREFLNITIIDYPYKNTPRELYDSGILNKYIFPSLVCAAIVGLSIALTVQIIKKRKAMKND